MTEENTLVGSKQKLKTLDKGVKKHEKDIGDVPVLDLKKLLAETPKGSLTPIGTLGTKSITCEFPDESGNENVLKIYTGAGLPEELIDDILQHYPKEYQKEYRTQFGPRIKEQLQSAPDTKWLASEIAGAISAHRLAAEKFPNWTRPIDTAVTHNGQLIGHISKKISGEPLSISQIEGEHPEVWGVIEKLAEIGVAVDTFEGNVILEEGTNQPIIIDLELTE